MIRQGLSLLVATLLLLTLPSCGKKGDPFLPQKGFDARVTDLEGDARESLIVLKGNILYPANGKDPVRGCRVFYAQYPSESPPCEGCPIEYQGYHPFGPEVIQGKRLLCSIPGIARNEIYFFKAVLVGPGEVQGPPSNVARVAVQ